MALHVCVHVCNLSTTNEKNSVNDVPTNFYQALIQMKKKLFVVYNTKYFTPCMYVCNVYSYKHISI